MDILVQTLGLKCTTTRMAVCAQQPSVHSDSHTHAQTCSSVHKMPGPIPFTHKLRYVHLCLYTSRHVKFKDAHLYRHEHLHTHVGAMHTSTRAKKHLYTCDGDNDWGQGTWAPRAGAVRESTAVRMSREEVTEEPVLRRGHPSSLSPTAPESRFWAEPRGPPLGRAPAYRPSERRPSYSRNVPPKAPRVNQPWPPSG